MGIKNSHFCSGILHHMKMLFLVKRITGCSTGQLKEDISLEHLPVKVMMN